MGFFATILTLPTRAANRSSGQVPKKLIDSAHGESAAVLAQLNTSLNGLTQVVKTWFVKKFGE